MQKHQISTFFKEAGFNYKEMELNKFYPITGWEILTHSAAGNTWNNVTHIIRKESCVPVIARFLDTQISVSPEHQFWTRTGGADAWIEAVDLVEESSPIQLLHEDGEWVTTTFSAGESEIDILDMTVENTESYYSNGVLSHNTMHGDPTTTSGGMAVPFHASVRLKLGAGQQIKDKDGNIVGINVSAKTVKNKVAAPFRTANFQIHFGKGIVEHEEIFDVLRDAGERKINNKIIAVGGDGAWKLFTVIDEDKQMQIIEKKFHKADFGEVLSNPEYKQYLDDLIDAVMVKTASDCNELVNVDSEENE